MPRQHFVDQRLIPNPSAARFLSELIEHTRIDTDRDELAGFVTEGGPAHAPHRFQLLGR